VKSKSQYLFRNKIVLKNVQMLYLVKHIVQNVHILDRNFFPTQVQNRLLNFTQLLLLHNFVLQFIFNCFIHLTKTTFNF